MTRFLLLSLIVLLFLPSCKPDAFCLTGKDGVETRTFDFIDFDDIAFGTGGSLFITEDTAYSITATGPADLLERLEFSHTANELTIESKKCISNESGLEIHIHLPSLEQITLSGNGNVFGLTLFHSSSPEIGNSGSGFLDMAFQAPDARITLTGSGDMDLNIYANSVQCDLQGSGDLTMKGTTLSQIVTVPGSGDFNGYGIPCATMDITVSGSGDSQVEVSSQLNATLSGSGDVYYKGNPVIISSVSGSGQLVDAN